MKLGYMGRAALALVGTVSVGAAFAQTATGLDIPANPQFLTSADPTVRKATAIVNGSVITGTDIDHRLALIVLANGGQVPTEELQRLRDQVLRNLVDETLQIQAAEAEEIKIEPREIEQYYERYSQQFRQQPRQFSAYQKRIGSSEASIKRQIQGELAWSRLQRRRIEPFVSVSEDEVRSIIDRLTAAKGTSEYRVSEIFLSATPETAAETQANAARIVQQIRGGASFVAYARQFSEASTAAVGGDLGYVRVEQLPDPLAQAVDQLPVGQVSDPIPVPGGFSIVAVQDKRQILTADARDAVLSLKQVSIAFPRGSTREAASPKVAQLAQTALNMGGCGGADAAAAKIGAEVVSSDQVRVRDLPPALQEMLLKLSIGQATTPFGSVEDGVRVLVLCGRDDPEQTGAPSYDQVYAQLEEQRVTRRAQRYLRDLRRDAVVDYR